MNSSFAKPENTYNLPTFKSVNSLNTAKYTMTCLDLNLFLDTAPGEVKVTGYQEHRTLLLTDEGCQSDASFLVAHFLAKYTQDPEFYTPILVATSGLNQTHYAYLCKKMGGGSTSQSFRYISSPFTLQQSLKEPSNGSTLPPALEILLSSIVSTPKLFKPVVILDDISPLVYVHSAYPVLRFLRTLEFWVQEHAGILILRSHSSRQAVASRGIIADPELEAVVQSFRHTASVRIEVSPLEAGITEGIHGHLRVWKRRQATSMIASSSSVRTGKKDVSVSSTWDCMNWLVKLQAFQFELFPR